MFCVRAFGLLDFACMIVLRMIVCMLQVCIPCKTCAYITSVFCFVVVVCLLVLEVVV